MTTSRDLFRLLTPAERRPEKVDRAALISTAILEIIRRALLRWIDHGDGAALAAARAEIEALLHNEFTRNERAPPAPDPTPVWRFKQKVRDNNE
jgi:hypothetical protein